MPPWKSQKVQGQRPQEGSSTRVSAGSVSSISSSPFRQAKPLSGAVNGELPLELLSSPSRGLDNSDSTRDLTNEATQIRYREYISQRLQVHRDKYGPLLSGSKVELFPLLLPSIVQNVNKWSAVGIEGAALGSLQDILLLVRRLREGCVAASRKDAFVIDVYALSTFLSLLIGDDVQLSSSLPRLLELGLSASCYTCKDVAQDIESLIGDQSLYDTTSLLDLGHIAALYLLWLLESGGQASRIGGSQKVSRGPGGVWLQERDRITLILRGKGQQPCQWMKITEEVHAAVTRDKIFQLRRILIREDLSIWRRALIRRSIERIRGEVWAVLAKAYIHAPLDVLLLGGEKRSDDWLEKVLLIDIEVMPASTRLKLSKSTVNIPDAWDDTIDQLSATLENASLQKDESTMIQLRATRLAAVFEAYQLPHSIISIEDGNSPLQPWLGRKVLQAGIPMLKLR